MNDHEIIFDRIIVLSKHSVDIRLSQDLKVFILFATYGFLSTAKLIGCLLSVVVHVILQVGFASSVCECMRKDLNH